MILFNTTSDVSYQDDRPKLQYKNILTLYVVFLKIYYWPDSFKYIVK